MSRASPNDQLTSEKQLAQLDASFEEDDDDELGDLERLQSVKALLFDVYRIQNQCHAVRICDLGKRSHSLSLD